MLPIQAIKYIFMGFLCGFCGDNFLHSIEEQTGI